MTDEELASLRRDELQIHTQPLKTQLPNFREAVIAAALLFLATASTLLLYKRSDNDGSESKMLHSEVETTQTTDTMRVLITGFLPFRGFEQNPSEQVALALNGTCVQNVCFDGIVLAVSPSGMAEADAIMREESKWYDLILHLGLEDSAKGLKFEVAATNIMASETNPSSGCQEQGEEVTEGSENKHFLPIDADAMIGGILPTTVPMSCSWESTFRQYNGVERLQEHIKELWSRDAGLYYCNELYYRSLSWQHAIRQLSIQPHEKPASAEQRLARAAPDVFTSTSRRSLAMSPPTTTPVMFIHLPSANIASVSETHVLVRDAARAILLCKDKK